MTTPEALARDAIDQRLAQAGWVVQGIKHFNPAAARGVAVREYPTDSGPADYVLLVDREPVGVIEAKRDEEGQRITAHEAQTARYANATLKWKRGGKPLRFLFEATGQLTRFTDGLDPVPRSREIFHFFRPEQLADWSASQARPVTLRGRIALLGALDPDRIADAALATAAARGITRSADTLTAGELAEARAMRVGAVCAPFDRPELRDAIENARRDLEQLIDHINLDTVIFAGYSENAKAQAKRDVTRFADFIAQHKDEIDALSFFFDQPYRRRALTFEMIEELHQRLARPPLMLTAERLWAAYARVQQAKVKGADARRQLTDLVQLVRFAIGLDSELRPFQDAVDRRFQGWIFRHNAQRGTSFTAEQTEWLRMIKDHIAASCSVTRSDFDHAEFGQRGGLQKAWDLFGAELDGVLGEMNGELVG